MLKRMINSKITLWIALVLIILTYGLRVINLDQDLPHWGLVNYQPKDEGCYALLAVNWWEYGSINPADPITGEGTILVQEHIRVNLLGNWLQMLGFQLFGDNYFGLRLPMVFLGLVNLLVMGLVLLELRKKYGKKTTAELWAILGLLAAVSMHFYFYVSSRTVEPSTLRMLFAQLVLLVWLKLENRKPLCFFLMGLIISISVFFVYITNVFLYLAAGLLLLAVWRQEGWRKFLASAGAFLGGMALLFGLAELYYFLYWDCGAVANFFGAIGLFTNVGGYELTDGVAKGGLLRNLIVNGGKFFSANFFLYAPALLVSTLLLVPVAIVVIFCRKDKTLLLLVAVPVSFLLQTLVSQDYVWRKLMVVVPYFIYLVYWAGLQVPELVKHWNAWCAEGGWVRKLLPVGIMVYILAVLGFAAYVLLYRLYLTVDQGKLDFSETDRILIVLLGFLPAMHWGLAAGIRLLRRKSLPLLAAVILLGGSTVALNMLMLNNHVWTEPTFEERDVMISLSEDYDLDGKYVLGDFVMGITLYNDLKPVIQDYPTMTARLTDYRGVPMFFYADGEEHFNRLFKAADSGNVIKMTEIVPGTLQVNGVVKDFALYIAYPAE